MPSNVVFYDAKYVCYIYMHASKKSVHLKICFKNIKNATLPVANPHSQVSNINLRGTFSLEENIKIPLHKKD